VKALHMTRNATEAALAILPLRRRRSIITAKCGVRHIPTRTGAGILTIPKGVPCFGPAYLVRDRLATLVVDGVGAAMAQTASSAIPRPASVRRGGFASSSARACPAEQDSGCAERAARVPVQAAAWSRRRGIRRDFRSQRSRLTGLSTSRIGARDVAPGHDERRDASLQRHPAPMSATSNPPFRACTPHLGKASDRTSRTNNRIARRAHAPGCILCLPHLIRREHP
jgi:hypothetical protein